MKLHFVWISHSSNTNVLSMPGPCLGQFFFIKALTAVLIGQSNIDTYSVNFSFSFLNYLDMVMISSRFSLVTICIKVMNKSIFQSGVVLETMVLHSVQAFFVLPCLGKAPKAFSIQLIIVVQKGLVPN